MTDLADFARVNSIPQAGRTPAPSHPKGWEPGVAWDGEAGQIVTRPLDRPDPQWDELLKSWGFDPDQFEIVEPVQVRTWDAPVGDGEVKQLWYYKANIRSRRSFEQRADAAELAAHIKGYKRPKAAPPTGDLGFVVGVADLQIGKGDFDGAAGTVDRVLASIHAVRDRYRELRKCGRKLGTLYVADMGDIIEGCYGNYSNQLATVQLNRRDQEKVARRLLLEAFKLWAPDFERVVGLAVPSNHTQNREGGKAVTDDGDDAGLAITETVAEVLAENPAFDHVSFCIPRDEMVVVLDVHGSVGAFTHAHKAERSAAQGGLPQGKVKSWWRDQAFSKNPAGDADWLLSAHYHHFSVIDHGPRVHIQCPTQDPGSKYFIDATGARSRPGFVTFVAGGGVPPDDIKVV